MFVFFVEKRSAILEEGDLFKRTVKACTVCYLCLFMQIPVVIYAPQVSAGFFLIGHFKQ